MAQWDRPESMPPTPQHEETVEHQQILEQQQQQQQQHNNKSEQQITVEITRLSLNRHLKYC